MLSTPGNFAKPRRFSTLVSMALLLSFTCSVGVYAKDVEPDLEAENAVIEVETPKKDAEGKLLESSVVLTVPERPGLLDELVQVALDRSDKASHYDQHVKKYNRIHQKALAMTKDALNYVFYYRGDSPSSEFGDVILNEKQKLKSKGSAEWLQQEHRDATELAVLSSAMEMAAAVGSKDEEQAAQLESSMAQLKELVGEEAANKALDNFKSWSSQVDDSHPVYDGKLWTISQRKNKQKSIMMACKDRDATIQDVVKKVHKYNGHSKLYLVTSRVVKTSLGVASMSPTFVAPASQVALFFYTMATGGAEEDKMLRELYLDRRLASRSRVISEKSNMALEYYQIAKLSKNPALLAFCETVVKQMSGQEQVPEILGTSVLEPAATTVGAGESGNDGAKVAAKPDKVVDDDKQDAAEKVIDNAVEVKTGLSNEARSEAMMAEHMDAVKLDSDSGEADATAENRDESDPVSSEGEPASGETSPDAAEPDADSPDGPVSDSDSDSDSGSESDPDSGSDSEAESGSGD